MEWFGIGFGGMFILSQLMFFLVFGIIIFTLIKGLMQWNKNNHSPRLSVNATVVSKYTNVSHHHHHGHNHMGHTSTSTSYYVVFEVDSGDRMEFHMSRQEFGMLIEGDKGVLSFQGTRYLGFERVF